MSVLRLVLAAAVAASLAAQHPAHAINPFKKPSAKEREIQETYKTKKTELKQTKKQNKSKVVDSLSKLKTALKTEQKQALAKLKAKKALFEHKIRLEQTLRRSGYTLTTLEAAVKAKQQVPKDIENAYNRYMHRDAVYQQRVKKNYDTANKALGDANNEYQTARGEYEATHTALKDLKTQKKADLKAAKLSESIIHGELDVAPPKSNSARYPSQDQVILRSDQQALHYDRVPDL